MRTMMMGWSMMHRRMMNDAQRKYIYDVRMMCVHDAGSMMHDAGSMMRERCACMNDGSEAHAAA